MSYLDDIYQHIMGAGESQEGPRPGGDEIPHLDWANVFRAFLLVIFSAGVANLLKLQFSTRIFVAAIRCMTQLTLLSYILKPVLESQSIWPVAGLTFGFLFCGVFEAVLNNAKYTFKHMGFVVAGAMIIALSLHLAYALCVAVRPDPFYSPHVWIPIAGMLIGQMIAGISLALKTILTSIVDHPERIETMLAYGATRIEIYRPALSEALRTGLLPTLNSMSVMGLISIPGQMTGQILAGADVGQAAHYQKIVMMTIFSCSMMGQLLSVLGCLFIVIDKGLVVRGDLITTTNFVQRTKRFFRSGQFWNRMRGYTPING